MSGNGSCMARRSGTTLAVVIVLVVLCMGPMARAQQDSHATQHAQMAAPRQIGALLLQQAEDWNRGDLDAFARGYKDAPDILFIGATTRKGYAEMVAGYRKRYPNKEAMGTLTFTALAVQLLDARFATGTGQFALRRSAAGGGAAAGYFLLVLEKTDVGWRIVRDDTTGTWPKPACAPGG